MKREVGKGVDGKSSPQEKKVAYHRIYEEHKEGVLTQMIYLHLKDGVRTELPVEEKEACAYLGISKTALNKLVQKDLLKKYQLEGSKGYVFFMSEIKEALKKQ